MNFCWLLSDVVPSFLDRSMHNPGYRNTHGSIVLCGRSSMVAVMMFLNNFCKAVEIYRKGPYLVVNSQ